MGKIFTLEAEVKAVIQDALDDLITELGKDCKLVYPPKMVACDCVQADPIGRKQPNVWKTGGRLPAGGAAGCPACGGSGKKAVEVSEVVKFLCQLDPKPFQKSTFHKPTSSPHNLDLYTPGGYLLTKGYITDLPKIERCDYLVYQTALDNLGERRYKLEGEPGDRSNIIQNRYVISYWKRAG